MVVVRCHRPGILGCHWRYPKARHKSNFQRALLHMVRICNDGYLGDPRSVCADSLALATLDFLGSRRGGNIKWIGSIDQLHRIGIGREGLGCDLVDIALSAGNSGFCGRGLA